MKKLILTLILSIPMSYGDDSVKKSEVEILSDKELKTKMIAVVQDVKVETMLNKTSEFNECREKAKFDSKMKGNQTEKDKAIDAAIDCFKKKIGNNPAQLQKFSEDLNLQTYGLVRSKNMQDITSYLSNKMYKSLTGFDKEETDRKKYLESLQFKNKKQVDQKVFIDMYMTQLSKSALYEVSRYCFEDFRKTGSNATSWQEHWNGDFKGAVNDQGIPEFYQVAGKSDPSDILKAASAGISATALDPAQMEPFFSFCTENIKTLCQKYTEAVAKNTDGTLGSKSCLVMNRLQEIRTAITNTEKVQKDFDKMSDTQLSVALRDPVQFYKGDKDNSIDDLTNVTSMDMIKGGYKKNELIERCAKTPEDSECENFLVVDDSKEKILYDTEVQRSLEKEIQLARVKELKSKDKKSLEEYLEENAYFDLLTQFKSGSLTADEVEKKIGEIFDARKEAEIKALSDSIGKRQISEDDLKKDPNAKTAAIQKNAEELQSERTRLAQVVLFNNIITSHLSLMKYDGKKYEKVGQNVSAWIKESKEQNSSGTFNEQLFGNIQNSTKDTGSNVKDNTIVGLDMIESILGKTK